VSTPLGSGETGVRGAALTSSDPAWIGPHRLIGRLGTGGMGLVYLAEAPDGGLVAVKVIRPEYADDPVYRQRFRREADAASRVRDPGVARVLHYDSTGPSPFLVTEYVPGDSLRDRVHATGPVRGAELQAFALGVARALAGIHAAGVVHRDLKPANVILSPAGPRIVDFGIASAADAVTRFTTTGEIIGSVGWMAPEVLRQQAGTAASDVFSWGATVAFAATGRRPFGEGPDISVAHRVLSGPPPDLTGVPPRLAPLVVAALSPDPAARPAAAELATGSLRPSTRVMGAPEPTRVAPPPYQPPGRRTRPRFPVRAVLGSVAGGAALLAILGALAQHPPTSSHAGSAPTTSRPVAPATTASPKATRKPAPPRQPGVLVAARVAPAQDGDVVFTLTDLRCGLRRVGRGALGQDEPPGQRACVGRVAVRNVGDAQHLLPQQYLHDAQGRGYGSNGWLALRYGHKGVELQLLGAGETLTTTLVWELPAGVRPVDVEFHGDLLSLGTRRALG
jgi:serine/threonine protein kinase